MNSKLFKTSKTETFAAGHERYNIQYTDQAGLNHSKTFTGTGAHAKGRAFTRTLKSKGCYVAEVTAE